MRPRLGCCAVGSRHNITRSLAMPVNPKTSVDHVLGFVPPDPPVEMSQDAKPADDVELLKQLLNAKNFKGKFEGDRARIEKLRGDITGSSRRSTSLPTSSNSIVQVLENARLRVASEQELYSSDKNLDSMSRPDIEEPHPVDNSERPTSVMERYVISTARAMHQKASMYSATTLIQLEKALSDNANEQLSIELPYESMPKAERRTLLTSATSTDQDVAAAKDDGVVLLCFVDEIGSDNERVSMCTGFAVPGGDQVSTNGSKQGGALIVSCVHTLENATLHAEQRNSRGLALAMTRQGTIYPVQTLLSNLPDADLSLLQLADTPIKFDPETNSIHPAEASALRTLPVSPYPAVSSTDLAISSFGGWLPSNGEPGSAQASQALTFTNPEISRNRWARARLIGYKDAIGRVAETGTYDDLAQLCFKLREDAPETPKALHRANLMRSMTNFPVPGSSGGPVVDVESGSVVGVVRGHRTSQVDGSWGDAVPAEKIYEFFALPGFGKHR
ncbi:hypothetical protein MPSI1_003180 [Malassezia psittaci]|uniref:Uncharacterized protein n=1 Tax=Malassezia psittaci TaxID=1821823 RepID=A0AAF0FH95_9BASI|nr:hypothetical protein MPSI1_003180 [Malassezia psittaci]